MQEVSLEGMPPIKKPRKPRAKKHHTTKNVPVEVSIRRQLSEELGDDEPTKEQKFVLLQKYGVTAPRIDRLATKPSFMGAAEWKSKQNIWFKATKGLVSSSQRPRSNYRPTSNSQQPHLPQKHVQYQHPLIPPRNFATKPLVVKPWSQIKHKNPRHQSSTNPSRPNSVPTQTVTPRS